MPTPTIQNLRDADGRLGIIAGNGRFPLLVLERARSLKLPVQVAAIEEEASPEIARFQDQHIQVNWLGVGQLGKLLRLFERSRVRYALMAGQVQHIKIFAPGSPILGSLLKAKPDWRILKLLRSLPRRDTKSLIEGVIGVLAEKGIEFVSSTLLMEEDLAAHGVLTSRAPDPVEELDIRYGRPLARRLADLELGQTIVVKDQAVVAIEAMEGTDATIRRAAELVEGARLTVVKASRPRQDMRFDVPVLGLNTLEVLKSCHVSAFAIDAGTTLLLDRVRFLQEADRMGLALLAE